MRAPQTEADALNSGCLNAVADTKEITSEDCYFKSRCENSETMFFDF